MGIGGRVACSWLGPERKTCLGGRERQPHTPLLLSSLLPPPIDLTPLSSLRSCPRGSFHPPVPPWGSSSQEERPVGGGREAEVRSGSDTPRVGGPRPLSWVVLGSSVSQGPPSSPAPEPMGPPCLMAPVGRPAAGAPRRSSRSSSVAPGKWLSGGGLPVSLRCWGGGEQQSWRGEWRELRGWGWGGGLFQRGPQAQPEPWWEGSRQHPTPGKPPGGLQRG